LQAVRKATKDDLPQFKLESNDPFLQIEEETRKRKTMYT